jgi:predicted transcriptional regulator
MATPTTQAATKTVRIPPELHARLDKLAVHLNGSMADAIAWLFDPGMVRISVSPEQGKRWRDAAAANGMPVNEFVSARVEAAIQYGADPGALRRVHDIVYALAKAQGVIPRQLSTPGADEQVIHAPDKAVRPT